MIKMLRCTFNNRQPQQLAYLGRDPRCEQGGVRMDADAGAEHPPLRVLGTGVTQALDESVPRFDGP